MVSHMRHFHKQFCTEEETFPSTMNVSNKPLRPVYEFKVPRLSLDKNALKCKYCETYGYFNALKIHHINSHNDQQFLPFKHLCTICDIYMLKLSDIKEHMMKNHGVDGNFYSIFSGDTKNYKCSSCGNTYANCLFLRLHIKNKMRCVNARILRQESNGEFVDALKSDYVNYVSIQPMKVVQSAVATARKSTTIKKELMVTSPTKEIVDLDKTTVTTEIEGEEKTMSVKEFSNIYNIYPDLIIKDCKNDLEL